MQTMSHARPTAAVTVRGWHDGLPGKLTQTREGAKRELNHQGHKGHEEASMRSQGAFSFFELFIVEWFFLCAMAPLRENILRLHVGSLTNRGGVP
jgi:hypothetical protein